MFRTSHIPVLAVAAVAVLVATRSLQAGPAEDLVRLLKSASQDIGAGKFAEAEESVLEAKRLAEGPLRSQPDALAYTMEVLGAVAYGQGNYHACENHHRRVLEIRERTLGPKHLLVAQSLNFIGNALESQGKYEAAEEFHLRALELRAKLAGRDHPDTALSCHNLAQTYFQLGRYREAKSHEERALKIFETVNGPDHPNVAYALNNLGVILDATGECREALKTHERALQIRERVLGPNHPDIAMSLINLAGEYAVLCRYDEAQSRYKRGIEILETVYGDDHPSVAAALCRWAFVAQLQGKYEEAEDAAKRAVAINKARLGEMHVTTAGSLAALGSLQVQFARYEEAETSLKQAVRIYSNVVGKSHSETATVMGTLALCYQKMCRYNDARELLDESADSFEAAHGSESSAFAGALRGIGMNLFLQGRYAEAEEYFQRSMRINERCWGKVHVNTAGSMNNLASLFEKQGRLGDAERLFREALDVERQVFGEEHVAVALALNNLGNILNLQERYAEAQPLLDAALRMRERILGTDHPDTALSVAQMGLLHAHQGRIEEAMDYLERAVASLAESDGQGQITLATCLVNVADSCVMEGRYEDADANYQRALELSRRFSGEDHPETAGILSSIALSKSKQGYAAEAETYQRQALALFDDSLGAGHPAAGVMQDRLGQILLNVGRFDEAEKHLNKAIQTLRAHNGSSPTSLLSVLLNRATLFMNTARLAQAAEDLHEAMQWARQYRQHLSGSDQQRAATFGLMVDLFDAMVVLQAMLGDYDLAFQAIECSRAQGLQDAMAANHVDLLQGLPENTVATLKQAESNAQAEVAALQKQFEVLRTRADMSDEVKIATGQRLQQELGVARQRLVQAWTDIKSASPAHRLVVSEGREPVRLETLRKELDTSGTVALQYMLGQKNAYLLAYGGQHEPSLTPLEIDPSQAETLGCQPGPLTLTRAREILLGGDSGPGLLQHLTDLETISDNGIPPKSVIERLRTLWVVLVPDETFREQLADGDSFKRLLILPDGSLARLPFEALVVGGSLSDPEYLLDRGPATMYAPSATVFYNLKRRRGEDSGGSTLTVGNPRYGNGLGSTDRGTVLEELQVASRFASLGSLPELPWTGDETRWIRESCDSSGRPVVRLVQDAATEANVRENVRGRSLVHFACHGLADDSYGNLFGALAFTPVDASDPSNDGFLTVAEMFNLDLEACELAILSACDTNVGPNQRGEGTWSMCRGMLTSGARRVVTTDWQVADEASAHLVYALVYYLHESEAGEWDYAKCLRNARLSIRNHDNPQWHHPYFWAPFVLMGPE